MSIEKFLISLYNEFSPAKESTDNILMIFEKPIEVLLNKEITLYHGSYNKFDIVKPYGVNVGAFKSSNIRWSSYNWDDKDVAKNWAFFQLARRNTKAIWNSITNKAMILKEDINELLHKKFYVYEFTIKIRNVSVGSHPMIKEYTVDEEVKPKKIYEFIVTESIISQVAMISSEEDIRAYKDDYTNNKIKAKRSLVLSRILDKDRDLKRFRIVKDMRDGKVNIGDDLGQYREYVNESFI